MAPPWVLLHRMVNFVDGRATATGGRSNDREGFTSREGQTAAAIEWIDNSNPGEAMVAAMEPDPAIVNPPEVTRMQLRVTSTHPILERVLRGEVRSGRISSTHQGLIVFYGSGYRWCRCYLVYDAASNSLSSIPPLPESIPNPLLGAPPYTIDGLGHTTAILRHGEDDDGGYLVADLVTTSRAELPAAELFLWRSSSSSATNPAGQWTPRPVRLPLPAELCGPTSFFTVDMAFSFGDSLICWADLLAGLLVCDLATPQEPRFRFVPLPEGSVVHNPDGRRGHPQESRSIGRVGSAITFVEMIGFTQGRPAHEVAIKTWTLSSPDSKEWHEGSTLLVGDLWATESFMQMLLPRVRPMCPVLSVCEEGVVCVCLNDFERVNQIDRFGNVVGSYPKVTAHYVLLVDLKQNKVLLSTKTTEPSNLLHPYVAPHLLASDFSSHLHITKLPTAPTTVTKRREEAEEASTVAVVKRVKY
ncbi:hypothetical protein EJB05_05200, partial [Eragrostis curvula]